ncbi:MAG: hypothetical protein IH602_23535 [Bryobacteraceae bacterium]|nr:hypothetical protein [Bryobacteraceae bacterium]
MRPRRLQCFKQIALQLFRLMSLDYQLRPSDGESLGPAVLFWICQDHPRGLRIRRLKLPFMTRHDAMTRLV